MKVKKKMHLDDGIVHPKYGGVVSDISEMIEFLINKREQGATVVLIEPDIEVNGYLNWIRVSSIVIKDESEGISKILL